jgi:hypothetical protein
MGELLRQLVNILDQAPEGLRASKSMRLALVLMIAVAGGCPLLRSQAATDQLPAGSVPSIEETRRAFVEQARREVDAYLSKANTADAKTQREVARFLCDRFFSPRYQ